MSASYLALHASGELSRRAEKLWALFAPCRLCPRDCLADRAKGEIGPCKADDTLKIAAHLAHFGEEPPLTGTRGAGTIFFSNCHLTCAFCQNFQISQVRLGQNYSVEDLAGMMLTLQAKGCHNIDLVSPTHYAPHIVAALLIAIPRGLTLPLVYNSNGYESVEVLKLLDGIVDIYLPDCKYASDEHSTRISGVKDYASRALPALQEMHRQVGPLTLDGDGIAVRGLIVRHLVMPGDLSDTHSVLKMLHGAFGPDLHLSLMTEYVPAGRALKDSLLGRKLSGWEQAEAQESHRHFGFTNGWVQAPPEPGQHELFMPDFSTPEAFPFNHPGNAEKLHAIRLKMAESANDNPPGE